MPLVAHDPAMQTAKPPSESSQSQKAQGGTRDSPALSPVIYESDQDEDELSLAVAMGAGEPIRRQLTANRAQRENSSQSKSDQTVTQHDDEMKHPQSLGMTLKGKVLHFTVRMQY